MWKKIKTYPCFQQIELELSIASYFLESPKRASDLQARTMAQLQVATQKICPAKRVVPTTHTESQPIWLLVFKVYDDEYDINYILWINYTHIVHMINKIPPLCKRVPRTRSSSWWTTFFAKYCQTSRPTIFFQNRQRGRSKWNLALMSLMLSEWKPS